MLTGARMLGAVATLILTIILTRHFGTEIAAGFAVCMALAATLTSLGLAGFQAFAPILVAEYRKTGQIGRLRGFVLFSGVAATALTATLCLAVLGLRHIGALPLTGVDLQPGAVGMIAIIALAMTWVALGGGILTGLHRQRKAQLPETLLRPALVLTLVAMLALLTAQPALLPVVALAAGAFLVAATLIVGFLWRELGKLPEAAPAFDIRRWLRMAPSWLGITLVSENMIELLMLLAASMAGPEEVVLLHICFRYRMLTGFGVRSIYSMTRPRIHEAVVTGETDTATSVIGATNVLCLIYGLLVLAFVALFSDLLLGIFGAEFVTGKALLICVCSLVLVRAVFGPWIAVLGAADEHFRVALVHGLSLLVALGTGALLYPTLGILAIGIAYTVANALIAAVLWWLARRRTGLDCGIWATDFRQVKAQLLTDIAASSLPFRLHSRRT